jgi:battenin
MESNELQQITGSNADKQPEERRLI